MKIAVGSIKMLQDLTNSFPSSVPRKLTIASKSDTSILATYIWGGSEGNSPCGSETAGARTLSIFHVLNSVHQGAPLMPGILVLVRYLSYSSALSLCRANCFLYV